MRKLDDGYYVNRHSCFLLRYHLVFVTEYRKNVINKDIEEFLTTYFGKLMKNADCNLLEINYDKNHVHILFETPVTLVLTNFINGLKTNSAKQLRSLYKEHIDNFYHKPVFWSRSYFIGTVSEQTTSVVREYIKNHGA